MRRTVLFLAIAVSCHMGAQTVKEAFNHDTSPALTSIPVEAAEDPIEARRILHKVLQIPFPRALPGAPRAAAEAPAAAVQAPLKLAPISTPFNGIGPELKYKVKHAPPDTTGAAGTKQYVQWVNEAFAVFDKQTEKPVLGPLDGRVIWTNFNGICADTNDGDPIVLFDRMAKRWVLTQFSVNAGGNIFAQCVAVSLTDDATGAYHRYEFRYDDMNDYPKVAVWSDAYYVTYNMFRRKRVFLGAKVCALEREKMLAGAQARMVCFDVPNLGGLLPSDADSTPPPGMPNHLVNFGSDSLNVWQFHADWTGNASGSKLTRLPAIDVLRFDAPCPIDNLGNISACIPQGASTQPDQKLDAVGDRLMYRLAYRRLAGRDALTVNHTVKTGSGTGIRLYDLTIQNNGVTVKRQQTFAPDGRFRWIGSAAMDKQGNLLIGYTAAGVDLFPSIRIAGSAAAETAVHDERTLVAGTAAQVSATDPVDRWGDYTTMTIDPTDDCTFWYTAQIQTVENTFNWTTRIGHVKFDQCQ